MSTTTKEQIKTELEKILLLPYVLILWNDTHNTFDWVIECLVKVCNHQYDQASQCAHTVHYNGKCDVKRGDKETIQKMYEKLKSAGLTVTMETN